MRRDTMKIGDRQGDLLTVPNTAPRDESQRGKGLLRHPTFERDEVCGQPLLALINQRVIR
jgi:hypothetical protein